MSLPDLHGNSMWWHPKQSVVPHRNGSEHANDISVPELVASTTSAPEIIFNGVTYAPKISHLSGFHLSLLTYMRKFEEVAMSVYSFCICI